MPPARVLGRGCLSRENLTKSFECVGVELGTMTSFVFLYISTESIIRILQQCQPGRIQNCAPSRPIGKSDLPGPPVPEIGIAWGPGATGGRFQYNSWSPFLFLFVFKKGCECSYVVCAQVLCGTWRSKAQKSQLSADLGAHTKTMLSLRRCREYQATPLSGLFFCTL